MTQYKDAIDAKKRRNTYLIIAAVIVLFIVTVLVMKAVFQSDLDHLRAAEAKLAMQDIWVAANKYEFQQGEWPFNLHDLEEVGLWNVNEIDDKVYNEWTFYLLGSKTIRAISTYEMPGGKGMIVNYSITTDMFSGYGCPEEGELGNFEELLE